MTPQSTEHNKSNDDEICIAESMNTMDTVHVRRNRQKASHHTANTNDHTPPQITPKPTHQRNQAGKGGDPPLR